MFKKISITLFGLFFIISIFLNFKFINIINELTIKENNIQNALITQKYDKEIYDDPNVIFSDNFGKFKYTLGNGENLKKNSNAIIVEKNLFPQTPIIYGHNSYYGEKISDILLGELINITDETGKVSTYKVSDINILANSDKLKIDEDTLYIYTCFPFDDTDGFSTKRYVITAHKL